MQTTFNRFHAEFRQRGYVASSAPEQIRPAYLQEKVIVGLGIVKSDVTNGQYRLPNYNKTKVAFSADFVTSNSIAITVNGTAITQAFSSNHLTTMNALIAQIEALANISCALDATDTNSRTFFITQTGDLDAIPTSIAVTAGASQATATVTYDTTDVLRGIVCANQMLPEDANGLQYVDVKGQADCMTKGERFVYSETAVKPKDAVYLRYKDGGAGIAVGQFRNDSDSGTCVLVSKGATWGEIYAQAGVVKLILDLTE